METKHPETHERGAGHETRDASVSHVVWFGIALAVLLVVAMVATRLFYDFLSHSISAGPPVAPFETAKQIPPPGTPLIEPDPVQDYRKYIEQENRVLDSYGWVGQKAGVARIPIDRAMQLLLKRGLPIRASAENASAGIKPGEVQQYAVPQGYMPQQ